jgi:hypothetical protein
MIDDELRHDLTDKLDDEQIALMNDALARPCIVAILEALVGAALHPHQGQSGGEGQISFNLQIGDDVVSVTLDHIST